MLGFRHAAVVCAEVTGSVWGLFLYSCCEGLAWAGGSDSLRQILRGRFREQLQGVCEQGEDRRPVSALCLEASSFSSPCILLITHYSILRWHKHNFISFIRDFVKLGTAGWIVSHSLQSESGVGERCMLEFASPQREKSGRRFMASITQTTQLIPRHIGPGPKLCSIIRP
ncbi:hypothetical protein MHYP_G00322330 [Metynnis hypsauchen]